jgi:hypothetical protein
MRVVGGNRRCINRKINEKLIYITISVMDENKGKEESNNQPKVTARAIGAKGSKSGKCFPCQKWKRRKVEISIKASCFFHKRKWGKNEKRAKRKLGLASLGATAHAPSCQAINVSVFPSNYYESKTRE